MKFGGIMRKAFILLSLLSMIGCSHYQAASKGEGEYSGRQVESCSTNILGFALEPEKARLDYTIESHNLSMKNIYSVENKKTMYLGYFLFTNCTVVSLNRSGEKKVPAASISSAVSHGKKQVRAASVSSPINYGKKKFIEEYKEIATLKGCDKFISLERSACRKEVYRRRRKK